MILSDKVYKILKWIALIALPAIGTFYSTIGAVWNLPYTAEVAKTLQAVGTLIGVLIGVSAMNLKSQSDIETEETNSDEN
nr:phage holin [uncultured Lachnoclostridium sp.]